MEPASPARLYAAVVGALLVVLGILGFFYNASFDAVDGYEDAFGFAQTNGWLNLFYVATGTLGLLMAGAASRRYSLAIGFLYTVLAIVGWGTLGLLLAVGLLGLAAAAGTPNPNRKPRKQRPPRKRGSRKSETRAKAAAERA
ncbi:MAG: DUF4383 domain-containing protein [Actinomycetota bacterium]|nr:DUF4383 domain-containing protein [Actinomycetota bacterium]